MSSTIDKTSPVQPTGPTSENSGPGQTSAAAQSSISSNATSAQQLGSRAQYHQTVAATSPPSSLTAPSSSTPSEHSGYRIGSLTSTTTSAAPSVAMSENSGSRSDYHSLIQSTSPNSILGANRAVSGESSEGSDTPTYVTTVSSGSGSFGYQQGVSHDNADGTTTTNSTGVSYGIDGVTFDSETETSKVVPGSEITSTQQYGPLTVKTTTDSTAGTATSNESSYDPEKGHCVTTQQELTSGTETNVTITSGGKVLSSNTTGWEVEKPAGPSIEKCTGGPGKEGTPSPSSSPALRPSPWVPPLGNPSPSSSPTGLPSWNPNPIFN